MRYRNTAALLTGAAFAWLAAGVQTGAETAPAEKHPDAVGSLTIPLGTSPKP